MLTKAPATSFVDDELRFDGLPEARVSFSVTPTHYVVLGLGLPAGTKLTLGSEASDVQRGYATLKMDVSSSVAALAPKDAFDHTFRFDPKAKLGIRFSETASVEIDLPPRTVASALEEAFAKAADTPLTIGAPQSESTHHTVLLTGLPPEVLGPAKTVSEVDWVALDTKLPPRVGQLCTGYKVVGDTAKKDTSEKSYRVQMIDETVTVYEVRTGRVMGKKDFAAEDRCPAMTFGDAKTYPSSEAKKSWLRELRAGR